MAYDYNSRLKWEKARLTAWEESHKKEINRLSKEKRELFDAVSEFSRYPAFRSLPNGAGRRRKPRRERRP